MHSIDREIPATALLDKTDASIDKPQTVLAQHEQRVKTSGDFAAA